MSSLQSLVKVKTDFGYADKLIKFCNSLSIICSIMVGLEFWGANLSAVFNEF